MCVIVRACGTEPKYLILLYPCLEYTECHHLVATGIILMWCVRNQY